MNAHRSTTRITGLVATILGLLVASAAFAQAPSVRPVDCGRDPRCERDRGATRVSVEVAVPPHPVVVVEQPAPPSRVVIVEETAAPSAGPIEAPPPPGPVTPAPGAFHLGYLGGYDGTAALHGATLRIMAHLIDVLSLEIGFGVRGRPDGPNASVVEVPITLGLRVAVPIVTPIVRIYGVLATGGLFRVRSVLDQDPRTIGEWPAQLGGGIEVGGPLDERWSAGAFVDVRMETRVPFEQLDPTIGVAWSAGFAMLWF